MYEMIGKYFWIVVIVSLVNSAVHLLRSTSEVGKDDAEIARGRRRLAIGYGVLFNIPWLVVGFGVLTGRIETIFQCFSPRLGPPFSFAWILTTWAVCLPVAVWILLGKGARVLARHFMAEGEARASTVKRHTGLALLILVALSVFVLVQK